MIRRTLSTTAALLAAFAPAAFARMSGANVAKISAAVKPAVVTHGGKGVLAITVAIAPGFHVNANKPTDPDLIATVFTPGKTPGVTFGVPKYPAATALHVSYEPKPMLVYQGAAVILVPYTIARAVKPGAIVLKGTLRFQGCNATSCFPPVNAPALATVTVK